MKYTLIQADNRPYPIYMILSFEDDAILDENDVRVRVDLGKTKLLYASNDEEQMKKYMEANRTANFDFALDNKGIIRELFQVAEDFYWSE